MELKTSLETIVPYLNIKEPFIGKALLEGGGRPSCGPGVGRTQATWGTHGQMTSQRGPLRSPLDQGPMEALSKKLRYSDRPSAIWKALLEQLQQGATDLVAQNGMSSSGSGSPRCQKELVSLKE